MDSVQMADVGILTSSSDEFWGWGCLIFVSASFRGIEWTIIHGL